MSNPRNLRSLYLGCCLACLLACSSPAKTTHGNVVQQMPGVVDAAITGFDAGPPVKPVPPAPDASLGDSEDAGGDAGQPVKPVVIDECTGSNVAGLSASEVTALQAGGDPSAMRMLYPYDGTVFPRGLSAPTLMWDAGPTLPPLIDAGFVDPSIDAGTPLNPDDAVYVHLHSSLFDYKGCLKPTAAGQLQLPETVWQMAGTQTRGSTDPFTLEVSVRSVAPHTVKGLVKQAFVIAGATLKGSIYYNSYSSMLPGIAAGGGGAVLRIRPGQTAEVFLGQTSCTGCHSMSAEGTRMIAQANDSTTGVNDGKVWQLDPMTNVNPAPLRGQVSGAEFSGMSPDGVLYIETAHDLTDQALGPTYTGTHQTGSTLWETDTGLQVMNSGIPASALTPTFSPSGKLVTWNDGMQNLGHSLSVMSFDATARKATSERVIFNTQSMLYPAWPFVLPDDKGVVFALGQSPNFSGSGQPVSDLMVADIASGTGILLARAMGYDTQADATAEKTYLPFATDDTHKSYFPTVSPVAAGGYFWVFFDSMRHYGNRGFLRQLWGFAVDVRADGKYTSDPSHPAFYLPGQEVGTGNHRAFTALDPCHKDGASCETGIDCCNGFCTEGICKAPPPEKPRCSKTDEACKSSSDCCDKHQACVAGFCESLIVQ